MSEKHKSKPQWYHFPPARMAITKTSNKQGWGRCGETGILIQCWRECKMMLPFGKQSHTVKYRITWFTNDGLRYPPEKTKAFTQMFTAALLITAKKWEHLQRPSKVSRQTTVINTHTMTYYSPITGDAALAHATPRTHLENIPLSDKTQSQKTTQWVIALVWNVHNGQFYRDRKWVCGCQALGETEGLEAKGKEWGEVSLGRDKEVPKWVLQIAAQLVNTLHTCDIHFKWASCMVYELYLNNAIF